MEEASEVIERASLARRLAIKGLSLGLLGLVVALGTSSLPAGIGALAGVAAAAAYAGSYVASHLERRNVLRPFDGRVARSAVLRLVLVAIVGAGVWLAGREPFIGFLVAFSVAFAVFALTELPRAYRARRSGARPV